MNVSLTPELERRIAEKLESGLYTTASEVVREALRLLFAADEARDRRLNALRSEIQVGLDQLDRGEAVSRDALRDELTNRIRAARRGMSGYVVSPAARQDLLELIDYIAADSSSAAARVLDDLLEAFDRLAEQPGLGHARDDLTAQPVRFWTVGKRWLVVYRERDPLEFVRVFGPGRDVVLD